MFFLVKILIVAATWGSLFYIFFDYHKKSNYENAILFIFLVVGGTSLTYFLVSFFGFDLLYALPIFAFVPFGAALMNLKK